MLTSRGWGFLIVSLGLVLLAGLAPPYGHTTLVLVGMTMLLWFLAQWLTFALRIRLIAPRISTRREVHDERGRVENLWAGRSFHVRVQIVLDSWLGLPYAMLSDRVPFGVKAEGGETQYEGEVQAGRPIELAYRIHCLSAGQVRFEGVRVQLADLQGFFYHAMFVTDARVHRVLPMLVDAEGRGPSTKRHNLLPPPGVHRLRRPGSGSELLDLRDYLPGDPPKMIAWKVSARRDRLITKEFESEVPVRCTLFVDTSNSVRLGPPGQNALSGEVEIAAAVAQATVGARDLVGLCLFDEEKVHVVRPGRTPHHLNSILNQLADAAGLAPTQGKARIDGLLPAAFSFADEVYPHLLAAHVNRYPFWLPWLSPQPHYAIRHPTFGDRLFRWLPVWLGLYALVAFHVWFVGMILLVLVALYMASFAQDLTWPLLLLIPGLSGLALTAALWRLGSAILFPVRRRMARWRKLLAAVLSVRHGLAPGGLAMLMEDDDEFSYHVQRFLSDHHVPYALPLYDRKGRYLFASPGKVEVLAKALLNAVAHSHDNELFVLLADLLELPDQLGPLLAAVSVALARHHQVMIVCPWPPGVAPPPSRQAQAGFAHAPFRPLGGGPLRLTEVLQQATTLRFHEAFHRLRHQFARVGAAVLCAQGQDPAPLIVERLDRLRTVRFRPRI
ncbi:MAG: DUF58 domain-containing protein [Gemmataceae bacterium]|nr:DUF58 domain-containing protein [Gemmataceae bacterium]